MESAIADILRYERNQRLRAYAMPTERRRKRLAFENSTTHSAQLAEQWVFLLARGQLMITSGVANLGNEFVLRALQSVREFSDFTEDNDPYGEHDFGSFALDGEQVYWKIDYYDNDLQNGSPNPADAALTKRVLTILLSEEY